MKSTFLYALLLVLTMLSLQTPLNAQYTLEAARSEQKIKLDGIFDEEIWQTAKPTQEHFTTIRPQQGKPAAQKTEIRLAYTDDALYIAASMFDNHRDSISTQLVQRDNVGVTDFLAIIIDTYGNGTNAFEFIIQSTGVQFDARLTPNNEDSNWDAVWDAAVEINDKGWFAEVEIPYSAFRFPNQEKQNWKATFSRRRASSGEQSNWHPMNQEQENAWLTQLGTITGIENISPPVRLSLLPYAAAYTENLKNLPDQTGSQRTQSYNIGLDLKYGINDAFTLDMTLVPDFGQVRQDDQVLNLSPVEVFFQEQRPFFTEGVELFNKGGMFYSRRVGEGQQLLNATKISGRTSKGLGIGVFNALEAKDSYMQTNIETGKEEEILTNPFTNYNVFVLDQDLKNNSSLTFTNTSVLRNSKLFHNANVSALRFDLKNKGQKFGVSGNAAYSNLVNKESENVNGYTYNLRAERLSGSFRFGSWYEEFSKDYDNNDLGFIRYTHYRQLGGFMRYNDFNGFGKNVARFSSWLNVGSNYNIEPNVHTQTWGNMGFWFQHKKLWNMEVWNYVQSPSKDFYEPRVFGRHFNKPGLHETGFWFGSDSRKKVSYELFGEIINYKNDNWKQFEFGPELNFRFSDKFSLFLDSYMGWIKNAKGFVTFSDNAPVFGDRDQQIVSNLIGMNYTINANMNFNFRLRHYWTKVFYHSYFDLLNSGELAPKENFSSNDLTFSAFTTELNYRYQFAPGSVIRVLWKNNITGRENDPTIDFSKRTYRDGLSGLNQFPQSNSLSVSIIYFLDYARDIQGKFN